MHYYYLPVQAYDKLINYYMSFRAGSLGIRDMWAFVTVKGGSAIGEDILKRQPSELGWPRDLHLRVNVPLV